LLAPPFFGEPAQFPLLAPLVRNPDTSRLSPTFIPSGWPFRCGSHGAVDVRRMGSIPSNRRLHKARFVIPLRIVGEHSLQPNVEVLRLTLKHLGMQALGRCLCETDELAPKGRVCGPGRL
jgi:hypothetical protein